MSTIILRNYYSCAECARYTTNQKKLEIYHVDSPFNVRDSGFYSYLGGVLVKIFKCNNETSILLEVSNARYFFNDLTITTRDVERISDEFQIYQKRHISIQKNSNVIFKTDYDEIELTFENDPTPFIEDEHFDYGLFLENLSKNPERQERLYELW